MIIPRRPHSHHRDLRARLLAAPSAGGIPNRGQDRHLMIAAVGGNITNLRVNFAGSRPATKLLAAAANLGYKLLNKSLLNAGSARHGRAIKPANLLGRI